VGRGERRAVPPLGRRGHGRLTHRPLLATQERGVRCGWSCSPTGRRRVPVGRLPRGRAAGRPGPGRGHRARRAAAPGGRGGRPECAENGPRRGRTLVDGAGRHPIETAARATEILTMDVADLDPVNKRARVTSKGGDSDCVNYQTERFGVRKGTLRFYEQLGLLAPHRRGTTHLPPRGPASAGLRAALPGWGAESGGHRPSAGRRRRELARRRPCLVRARLHHVEAELRAVPRGGVEFRMPCDHVLRCRSRSRRRRRRSRASLGRRSRCFRRRRQTTPWSSLPRRRFRGNATAVARRRRRRPRSGGQPVASDSWLAQPQPARPRAAAALRPRRIAPARFRSS